MPKVPYPYEVNWHLFTVTGSLTPICSLSNCSLSPSLTVHILIFQNSMRCTLTSYKRNRIEFFCNSTHTKSCLFLIVMDFLDFFLNFTRTSFELYLYVFQEVVLYLLYKAQYLMTYPINS